MQICSSSHNHTYHQPISFHWSLSWSKTARYIRFSKNPTLPKKTYPTTDQYLTYLTYPNLQNDLLKTDSLTISMKTTSWTLSSLPTPNSTLLKPLYLLYTTTLSEPWVSNKSLASVLLIFLLPLTLMTIPFFCIASNLGLDSLKLSYLGFTLTFHLGPSLLISMASNLLPLNFSMVFLKVLFLALFSSLLYTTPLSTIIFSIICQAQTLCWWHSTFPIIFKQMLSQRKFNSYRIQFLKFLHGWLLTFYLWTLLKLNFFSLVFQHNLLKFTIPHLQFLQIQRYNLCLLLKILVLSLILIFLFLIISHTFQNLASLTIWDLRRIRNTLDHKTACTIATFLIHSKLDYCNSLHLNINSQQLNRLQLILNFAARVVTKTPKFHHITPHLKSLHWLKIGQRIQYKILSLTYKSLQYNKPSSISHLTIQPTRSTRSLQLSLSNALPIPLGSKFLTDFSTFKLLLFGMLYHTIFVLTLILLKPILCSHYLLLNFTSSWKLTFSFIPILLSLSLYWTDPLELRSGLLMSFIIHFTSFYPRPVHLLNSLWFDVFHSVSE